MRSTGQGTGRVAAEGEAAARGGGGPAGWISVLIPAALFVLFLRYLGPVAAGRPVRTGFDWMPALDIRLSFLVDGLSLTFALLISGIGVLIALYSARYLGGHRDYARFVLYLTGFMAGMLGLVLSDNLIALFVFWEVTTVTSYLLIGFANDDAGARRAALQALLVTAAGGLALLAGIVLLGQVAGSYELSTILTRGEAIRAHPLYGPITVLFLAGAFTKSAQVPFHFWLPNAMAAPTPVSAYLHSATMVKAGVFLMARMTPALGGTPLWFWALVIAGGVTAVFASVLALRQNDMKQMLAYTTLMALGTLTMFIGAGTPGAITAMMLFLVVHSLYKAAMFLVAGIVDHATGTRELDALGGLVGKMPLTALAAGGAALSMAGVPPLVGFIGKEFLYKAGLGLDTASAWVTATTFAASALMFAVAGIMVVRPFLGPVAAIAAGAREGPWQMLAGPAILAGLGLAFGLVPDLADDWLVGPGTAAVLGQAGAGADLYLFRGVNAAFYLSLATFAAGGAVYAGHRRLGPWLARVITANPVKFDPGWDRLLDALVAIARWQTRQLQSGVLQRYLFTVFATLGIGVAATIWARDAVDFRFPVAEALEALSFKHWAVLVFVTAGSILAALTSSRMTAVAALGVVGIGVALIFIMFSAPDVAITQLLVETLVVVLVAVAMLKLPHLDPGGRREWRPWHAALAVFAGAVVTLVLLGVLQAPLDRRVTDFFETASWPEAFGRNIVNVILVDFRALDTFGEIAVVLIAALAAYALLKGTHYVNRGAREQKDDLP